MSRIKQIFGGGTTDHLLRDAKGIAVWVEGVKGTMLLSIEQELAVRRNRKSLWE